MEVIVGTTAALGYMNDDDGDDDDGTTTTTKAVDNETATARLSQSISFTICLIGLSTSSVLVTAVSLYYFE
jgi:hypothetical protein